MVLEVEGSILVSESVSVSVIELVFVIEFVVGNFVFFVVILFFVFLIMSVVEI